MLTPAGRLDMKRHSFNGVARIERWVDARLKHSYMESNESWPEDLGFAVTPLWNLDYHSTRIHFELWARFGGQLVAMDSNWPDAKSLDRETVELFTASLLDALLAAGASLA